MTDTKHPPRGKKAVQSALLNAAATCFAERGIASTSIRDIAALAQVNHGLIHRHFGSKEGLLMTLLTWLSDQVSQHLDQSFGPNEAPPPEELIPHIFAGTTSVGLHWRVVLHALLEGYSPADLQSNFPVFRRLVLSYRQTGLTEADALAEATLTFSTGLGFLTFKGYLESAVIHEGSEWDDLRPHLMTRFLARHRGAPSSPASI